MEGSTKQFKKRNAILECLCTSQLHPSAEMVYEMLRQEYPDISLATVYRNISRFRSQGRIRCAATVRGIERFDACVTPHAHFICEGCDAVIDLPQIEVPQSLTQSVEETSGCHAEGCYVTFTGLCQKCYQTKETIS